MGRGCMSSLLFSVALSSPPLLYLSPLTLPFPQPGGGQALVAQRRAERAGRGFSDREEEAQRAAIRRITRDKALGAAQRSDVAAVRAFRVPSWRQPASAAATGEGGGTGTGAEPALSLRGVLEPDVLTSDALLFHEHCPAPMVPRSNLPEEVARCRGLVCSKCRGLPMAWIAPFRLEPLAAAVAEAAARQARRQGSFGAPPGFGSPTMTHASALSPLAADTGEGRTRSGRAGGGAGKRPSGASPEGPSRDPLGSLATGLCEVRTLGLTLRLPGRQGLAPASLVGAAPHPFLAQLPSCSHANRQDDRELPCVPPCVPTGVRRAGPWCPCVGRPENTGL